MIKKLWHDFETYVENISMWQNSNNCAKNKNKKKSDMSGSLPVVDAL